MTKSERGSKLPYLSADDRRRPIVDAAVAVIAEEGFARATTRRIAERADAPLGSLHYCFKNKTELMELVLERGVQTIHDSLSHVDPSKGVDATIRGLVDARWKSIRDNLGLHSALVELLMWTIRRHKPGAKLYMMVNDPYGAERTRDSLLAAAQADGVALAVPAEDLTRLLMQWQDGLVFAYAESGDRKACARQARLLADSLVLLSSQGEGSAATN